MAEQVAAAIREAILAGDWLPGEALPPEPKLAEQFDVSRAVIRDATRLLVARGLVDAQHGRGVFVTESQVEAFGDALLLALRRAGATVWDVERFEQLLYPEVIALAAVEVGEDELEAIKVLGADYLADFETITATHWQAPALPSEVQERLMRGYRQFIAAIFAASHNELAQLLAIPLLRLRTLRHWEDRGTSPDELVAQEAAFVNRVLALLASDDMDQARRGARALMQLPPEAEAAMRQTPVGQTPVIRHRPS